MADWCSIEEAAKSFELPVENVRAIIADDPVPTKTDDQGNTLYYKPELEATLKIALNWELVMEDVTAASHPASTRLSSEASGPVRFKKGFDKPIGVPEAAAIMGITQNQVLKLIEAQRIDHQTSTSPEGDQLVLDETEVRSLSLKLSLEKLDEKVDQIRKEREGPFYIPRGDKARATNRQRKELEKLQFMQDIQREKPWWKIDSWQDVWNLVLAAGFVLAIKDLVAHFSQDKRRRGD